MNGKEDVVLVSRDSEYACGGMEVKEEEEVDVADPSHEPTEQPICCVWAEAGLRLVADW